MSTPAVSVVIPAFRVAPYIAETLDSVLAQTFQDFEIVVVNDGSPDSDALRAAVAPYRHRIVFLEQPQGGPSKARNTAIAAARGEWLAFLDGDDLWAPAFLASLLGILEREPDTVLAWADSRPFGPGAAAASLMTTAPPVGECDVAALLTARCVVITSTAVARRRDVVEAGGFDETLHRCEDFDLWLRLATRGRLRYTREVLGRRRLHASSQSAAPAAMLRAQIAVRRRFVGTVPVSDEVRRLSEEADRRCEAEIALGEGHRLLAAGDARGARQELTRAAQALPSLKLAATLRLLAVAPSVAVALQRWRR
jgi:GT2 family glycosyltransferase